jgi:hypothetical protein
VKYELPATAVCDHCLKKAPSVFMCIEAGDLKVQNLVVPPGWVSRRVESKVAPPPGMRVQVDLTKSPQEVAAKTGRVVEGVWCSEDCLNLDAGHEVMRSLLVPG